MGFRSSFVLMSEWGAWQSKKLIFNKKGVDNQPLLLAFVGMRRLKRMGKRIVIH